MLIRIALIWQHIGRLAYALLAIALCVLLAFRPVPSEVAENDTGRYVAFFQQYCKGLFTSEEFNKEVSFELFNLASSPACLSASDSLFLFQAAFYIPLAMLLFAGWRRGTFFWAASVLASFYGLELMINTLRQGFAMLMFFGALAMVRKNAMLALIVGALAAAAHASALAFYPFVLWASVAEMTRKDRLWSIVILLLAVIGFMFVYRAALLGFIIDLEEMLALYREFYAEESNPLFLIYLCFPLYFVYGLRRAYESESMSMAERHGIVYSTAAIGICLVLFPVITFRIALFAVVMQIFLVVDSERHEPAIGAIALAGFFVHLAYFHFNSTYYDVLFTG